MLVWIRSFKRQAVPGDRYHDLQIVKRRAGKQLLLWKLKQKLTEGASGTLTRTRTIRGDFTMFRKILIAVIVGTGNEDSSGQRIWN